MILILQCLVSFGMNECKTTTYNHLIADCDGMLRNQAAEIDVADIGEVEHTHWAVGHTVAAEEEAWQSQEHFQSSDNFARQDSACCTAAAAAVVGDTHHTAAEARVAAVRNWHRVLETPRGHLVALHRDPWKKWTEPGLG